MGGIHTQFKKGEHRSLKTEFFKGGIPCANCNWIKRLDHLESNKQKVK